MSITCPTCGATAFVTLTRTHSNTVRRRHQCSADPAHKFSTVQTVVKDYQRVHSCDLPGCAACGNPPDPEEETP